MAGGQAYRVGNDPEIVTAAPVREFYEYWVKVRGSRRFPAKADIDIAAIPRLAAGLILLKVHREPLDFEYRIVGDDVANRFGNLKGKRVRDAALVNVTSSAYDNYCAVVRSGLPQFLEGQANVAFRPGQPSLLSRVHGPLSGNGQDVDHIVSCVAFHH
jgi:hypothetical protein